VIDGSEKSVDVRIPEKELLVAVKLHSGRLTDARDVVALADALDVEAVETHLNRGDGEKLRRVLGRVDETIAGETFEDSFKGVFRQGDLPEDNIERVRRFIQDYR